MKIKLFQIIFILCLIFSAVNSVSAQSEDIFDSIIDEADSVFNEEIFSSLKSLSVRISFEEAPLLKGFAEQQIQKDIETALRQAGFVNGGDSYISINVKSIYSGNSITSFLIRVSFIEKFLLARNKNVTRDTVIWSREREIYPDNTNKNTIKNTILDLVDKFIRICRKAQSNSVKNIVPKTKELRKTTTTQTTQSPQQRDQESSPFTATFVGGNRLPELEVFNDSNRTLYFDFGQGKIIAYTIPSGTSKIIQLTDGAFSFKATAPRVLPLEGKHNFQRGYRYTWRFTIVKQ